MHSSPSGGVGDGDSRFSSFVSICAKIALEASYNGKVDLLKDYFANYTGDVYTFCRLMLCRNDISRIYNLKEKQMVKIISRVLSCDHDDMLDHFLTGGSISNTAMEFFVKHGEPLSESVLGLQEVDRWLDKHGKATKEDEQVHLYSNLMARCTAEDLEVIVRLVQKDLKINIGPKYVLGALHPRAYDAFMRTNNLKTIVQRVINHQMGEDDGPTKKAKLDTGLAILHPIKPMLARPLKSIQECAKRCPNGMLAEIKYDGERIQIHKSGSTYKYFSRNLKPVLAWKVEAVEPYIPKATCADEIILDGEILLMDTKTGNPLPFGTLGIHKKNNFSDATVCVFIFDIIMLDGVSFLDEPITKRRSVLENHIKRIPNRVELSEARVVQYENIEDELSEMMAKAMREKLEGLVLKPLQTIYKPNARHWLKLKKDYLAGMGDSADLVLLGGYWGTGTKGGLLSIFLMGTFDREEDVWKTVCKVGNGFDDAQLLQMQPELKSIMTEVYKDHSKCPSWLDVKSHVMPDWLVNDPTTCPVWEIMGAEFTCTHGTHTGPSIRFPRVIRVRDDKDFESHTSLDQLVAMMEAGGKGDAAALLRAGPAIQGATRVVGGPSKSPLRSRSPARSPRHRKKSRQPKILDMLSSPSTVSKLDTSSNAVAAVVDSLPEWPEDEELSIITNKRSPPRASRGGLDVQPAHGCTSSSLGPHLPSIFSSLEFALVDFSKRHARYVKRYVIAYDGEVELLSENTTHIIAESWSKDVQGASESYPTVPVVYTHWIWDCIDEGVVLDWKAYAIDQR